MKDFGRGQVVGVDIQVSMLAGMPQAIDLNLIFTFIPIELAALDGYRVGDIQVNENLRIREALPHIGDVRMLLSNMPDAEAIVRKARDQGRFPGSTGSDNSYLRPIGRRFFSIAVVARVLRDAW